MAGPSDRLRGDIERGVDAIVHELAEVDDRLPDTSAWVREIEDDVVRLLNRILDECLRDIGPHSGPQLAGPVPDRGQGLDLYAAVQAWAALASYAVARVYAPGSPWHHGLTTVSKQALAVLSSLAAELTAPLHVAADALGASSYSVGTQFPSAPLAISLSFASGRSRDGSQA
ncbi:hypothetical protein [Sinomonas atrocyanea]